MSTELVEKAIELLGQIDSGEVTVRPTGETWDYLDTITSPDGEVLTFDDMQEGRGDQQWEYNARYPQLVNYVPAHPEDWGN